MRLRPHNQLQTALEVVDHSQRVALQQHDVGVAQGVGWAGVFEFALNVAHGVIAKIARQTAAKARHACRQMHLVRCHFSGNHIQRIAQFFSHLHAVCVKARARIAAKTAGGQPLPCGQADKAIAPKAFAAQYRFKQKAVRTVLPTELEVNRQRGF